MSVWLLNVGIVTVKYRHPHVMRLKVIGNTDTKHVIKIENLLSHLQSLNLWPLRFKILYNETGLDNIQLDSESWSSHVFKTV